MGISFNKNGLNLNTSQSLQKATVKADNLASKKVADTAKQAVSLNKSSASASSFDSEKVFEKEPDMPDKPKTGGDGFCGWGGVPGHAWFDWFMNAFGPSPSIPMPEPMGPGGGGGRTPVFYQGTNPGSPIDIKLPDKPDIDKGGKNDPTANAKVDVNVVNAEKNNTFSKGVNGFRR